MKFLLDIKLSLILVWKFNFYKKIQLIKLLFISKKIKNISVYKNVQFRRTIIMMSSVVSY